MIGCRGLAACALLLLGACSHAGSVSRVATDYNRAFAEARDEQLLINILRAGAREPLMFSAPAEVNASVNRTVGLDTVATNLITGGRDAISPTLRLGGSTIPTVKIAPLSNKDFTDGLLQPISPERLHLFLSQGWDAEFLLPLVVQSYKCPGETQVHLNSGEDGAAVARLAAAGSSFKLERVESPAKEEEIVVATEAALALGGEMAGYRVARVTPMPPASVKLTLRPPSKSSWKADMEGLCSRGGLEALTFSGDVERAPPPGTSAVSPGELHLRSVEGIIYFLGQSMRPCVVSGQSICAIGYEDRQLFRIYSSSRPGGAEPSVATRFHDRNFAIPRLDSEDEDRTLKTLSFLSQLIALQTSAAPLTPTIIGLPQ